VSPPREALVPGADQATAFTHAAFCRVWAETFGLSWEPLRETEGLGVVFAQSRRLGLRNYSLGPRGLYWGASGPDADPTAAIVRRAADQCRGARTVTLTWNFRHDARVQLEQARAALGASRCTIAESRTHVLPIGGRTLNDILTRQVKGVTRRQAGYASAAGVAVRPVRTAEEFSRHDAIYRAFAAGRGISAHPAALFPRLATELGRAAQLFGAFQDDDLIAAILVFCDREEWFYWHGVRDPERDGNFAIDALVAHAVDAACRSGARWFNMGASNDIRSLEFFKERWGAESRPVWSLSWAGRVWPRMVAGWRRIQGDRTEGDRAGRASGLPD
jgi:Acetyltransferase (GNAT) domain